MEQQKKAKFVMEQVGQQDMPNFNKFLKNQYKSNVQSMPLDQLIKAVKEYKRSNGKDDFLLDRQDESMYKQLSQSRIDIHDRNFSRKTQLTRSIGDPKFRTDLNLKTIQIECPHSEIVKAGFLQSDYVIFYVTTTVQETAEEFKVERQDQDFYKLRNVLLNLFPYTLVPPLPKEKVTKCQEKEMRNRTQLYNRFLTGIGRSEVFKSCKFVQQFLTVNDRKYFKIEQEAFEKRKFSKAIEDVISVEGQVSVEDRTDSKKFCDGIKTFQAVFSHISKEAMDLSKEVHDMSDQLAHSISKLALCVKELGQLYKRVRVTSQYKLFSKLSTLLKDTSMYQKNQGYLTKIYLGQAMKYYESEHQSLDEILEFRDQFKLDYTKQAEKLESKKNQLFKQDPRHWGYTNGSLQELVAKHSQLQKDKTKAFRYMLTSDTAKVQEMNEELCFYTNQCLDEVHRVGKDNGIALIDHFMDQGKIQCDYLQQQHSKWSEFVGYFGSLAWDQPETQEQKDNRQRRRRKRDQDEFELIDFDQPDDDLHTQAPVRSQNEFELVSSNNRTTAILFDQTPMTLQSQKQAQKIDKNPKPSPKEEKKDIQETLQKLLKDQESQGVSKGAASSTENTSDTNKSNVATTLQQNKGGGALFQAPNVVISKKKQQANRRTAPNQEIQSRDLQRTSNQDKAPTSDKNRTTVGLSEDKSSENQDKSSNEVSNLRMSESESHSEQSREQMNKSPISMGDKNRQSSQLVFDQNESKPTFQEVIQEESEKNSSEEPSQRTDTIVMDFDQPSSFIDNPIQRSKLNTETGQDIYESKMNKAPAREQTITEQITKELMQEPKQPIVQVQQEKKLAPVKPPPISINSLISGSSNSTGVQKLLNSKRQSILTQNQVDKLIKPRFVGQQEEQQSDFASNLPKLKPVKKNTAPQEDPKQSLASQKGADFKPKQETAVQRAIRKLQTGASDSEGDDDPGNMSFAFN